MRSTFEQISNPGEATSAAGLHALMSAALHTILGTVAPIAGLCVAAGVIVNVAQVSFRPSMTAIRPDFKKINPVSGRQEPVRDPSASPRASRRSRR